MIKSGVISGRYCGRADSRATGLPSLPLEGGCHKRVTRRVALVILVSRAAFDGGRDYCSTMRCYCRPHLPPVLGVSSSGREAGLHYGTQRSAKHCAFFRVVICGAGHAG